MAKWIYKKYNKGYTAWSEQRLLRTRYTTSGLDILAYQYPPKWDGSTYNFSGERYWKTGTGYNLYTNTNELERSYLKEITGSKVDDWTRNLTEETFGKTRDYKAGSYIGEVTAEDGTYPNNGLHSDGYYYIKDRQAFPEMWVNINGTNRKAEAGWVNVNGIWRSIEEIYVKVNGVWRKSE